MSVEDNFKGIHYRDLTSEQLESLTQKELLNKFLSDDVDQLNENIEEYLSCKRNSIGMFILTIVSSYVFGFYGLFLLIPFLFFFFGFLVSKSRVTWSKRTLFTTIELYRYNGDFCIQNDYLFDNHIKRIIQCELID